jgi:hypothetical protein
MVAPVRDWTEAFLTSVTLFLAALPAVIAAILLLIVGWVLAGFAGRLLATFLRRIQFDELMERSGIEPFLRRARLRTDAAGLLGLLVIWYIRLIFVLAAANVVGLTAVSGLVNQVLAFIPNALIALLILAAAVWLAQLAREAVSGTIAGAGLPSGQVIGTVSQIAVIAFGVVAAANQVGIGETVVNTLFIGIVAALALAFGLAFGIGGRDVAGDVLRDWRRQTDQALRTATSSATSPTPATPAAQGAPTASTPAFEGPEPDEAEAATPARNRRSR